MVANKYELSPLALATYEVYQRMRAVGLLPPTYETLSRQTGQPIGTIKKLCQQLEDHGLLVPNGRGRGKAAYQIIESPGSVQPQSISA